MISVGAPVARCLAMPRVHSHYENLKVARDASPAAVRLAYRVLTRRHHPDRHPDDADAERIMAIVNVAYSVLSDGPRRREHDAWIASAESEPELAPRPLLRRPTVHVPSHPPRAHGAAAARRGRSSRSAAILQRRLRRRLAIGCAVAVVTLTFGIAMVERFGGDRPTAVAVAVPGGLRPATAALGAGAGFVPEAAAATASPGPSGMGAPGSLAPNGRPWPAGSGYVDAYPQLNKSGLSEVIVDNRARHAPMFVKLMTLDGSTTPLPVRSFLVAAGGRFTLAALTSGTYELRYRDISSGSSMRSSPFILEEISTPNGLQPSSITITLDAPGQGGARSYSMGDGEF